MTLDLTPNEQAAALVLLQECLAGMGGSHPDDLKDDPYIWCSAETLQQHGWGRAEAAGTYGALIAKGIVTQHKGEPCDALDGWEKVATLWDRWVEAGQIAANIRDAVIVKEAPVDLADAFEEVAAAQGADPILEQIADGHDVQESDFIAALLKAGADEEAAKALGVPFPGIICSTLRSFAVKWGGTRQSFIKTAQLAGFNRFTAQTQWQRGRGK